MGNIVKFEEGVKEEKKRRQVEKIKKLNAIKKIFECTKCALKCARCGTQVDVSRASCYSSQVPYRFCTSCEEEFKDFLGRKRGKEPRELYWQNREWIATWETWIEYQKARRKYENSNEFKQLLNELRWGLG